LTLSHPAIRVLGWLVTLAAAAIYVFMLAVTLPHLSDLAGGMTMFDLRNGGYDFETARTILARLGTEGREYYESVQHVLDAFYPPLVALAVTYWMWRFAPRWRALGWLLPNVVLFAAMAIAVLAAAFDLTENVLVGQMLAARPDGLTAELVGTASGFTLAKTIAVSVSQTALLVLIAGPFIRRMIGGKG